MPVKKIICLSSKKKSPRFRPATKPATALTTLALVCATRNRPALLEYVCNQGADPSGFDLIQAAFPTGAPALDILLRAGLSPNQDMGHGNTLLVWAAGERGKAGEDKVEVLLRTGADPNGDGMWGGALPCSGDCGGERQSEYAFVGSSMPGPRSRNPWLCTRLRIVVGWTVWNCGWSTVQMSPRCRFKIKGRGRIGAVRLRFVSQPACGTGRA